MSNEILDKIKNNVRRSLKYRMLIWEKFRNLLIYYEKFSFNEKRQRNNPRNEKSSRIWNLEN